MAAQSSDMAAAFENASDQASARGQLQRKRADTIRAEAAKLDEAAQAEESEALRLAEYARSLREQQEAPAQ